jgi:hypothetical protein
MGISRIREWADTLVRADGASIWSWIIELLVALLLLLL